MNITLWALQILLGVFFVMSGYGKAFMTWMEIQSRVPWSDGVTAGLMRFIGWVEMFGGVGLILPAALKVQPKLTPLAAACLGLVMALATGFHLMRAEWGLMVLTIVLGAAFAFIAYGRYILKPIQNNILPQA